MESQLNNTETRLITEDLNQTTRLAAEEICNKVCRASMKERDLKSMSLL